MIKLLSLQKLHGAELEQIGGDPIQEDSIQVDPIQSHMMGVNGF